MITEILFEYLDSVSTIIQMERYTIFSSKASINLSSLLIGSIARKCNHFIFLRDYIHLRNLAWLILLICAEVCLNLLSLFSPLIWFHSIHVWLIRNGIFIEYRS
jgi:hypothetical protein